MTCKMAVWLDHRHAHVVAVCERKVTSHLVDIEETPRSRPGGGLRATAGHAPHGVDPDQRRDAHHARDLQRFYDRIIEHLARADEIHLMGPGQAKLELRRRLHDHKPLAHLPVALETVDRLTAAQIVAHARAIFGVPRRRAARA
jgi:hypothetical protein